MVITDDNLREILAEYRSFPVSKRTRMSIATVIDDAQESLGELPEGEYKDDLAAAVDHLTEALEP